MKERGGTTVLQILLLHLVLLLPATTAKDILPGCQKTCGNLEIPYPFGIGKNCSLNPGFNVICKGNIPILDTGKFELLELQLGYQMLVKGRYARDCYNSQGVRVSDPTESLAWPDLTGSPFTYSTNNKFTAIGCDTLASFEYSIGQDIQSGCMSYCVNNTGAGDDSCSSGKGCCQISIPEGLKTFKSSLDSTYNYTNSSESNRCSYAFLSDANNFTFKVSDFSTHGSFNRTPIQVGLQWTIGNQTCEEALRGDSPSYACHRETTYCINASYGLLGYWCQCKAGFGANSYHPDGCEDINECTEEAFKTCHSDAICRNSIGSVSCSCKRGYRGDGYIQGTGCTRDIKLLLGLVIGIGLGLLFLIVSSTLFYWVLKQRRLIRLREKFFLQNGGLLLQQQITSRTGISDTAKIFTIEDLKRATDNYDESRILGQGGYGTVYKGILPNKKVVAIKKSKLMDESQITQFINEVDILSQINHRNVVKLLGCCLETEVPVLVYEFVSNGTLLQRIRKESNATTISWGHRLRIASETAGALAYLHSAHSIPVLHRDVKSANILLDDNYIAKVSDFGASRLVPLDQTQMTTLVQGTLGYLDPECFQTCQLTEKSDVYSFGVVLVELLTGEKPLSLERSEENRSLAMYFISSIRENRLFQILDDRVVNEGGKEQLLAFAQLARRCLKLKGEDRPTMKEVAAELDKLRMFQEHPWVQQNYEETEILLGEPSNSFIGDPTGQYSVENNFMLPLEIAR